MLKLLGRLYREEQGAVKLEYLLIVAAISLPLLGLLWWYREDLGRWLEDQWNQVRGNTRQDVHRVIDPY